MKKRRKHWRAKLKSDADRATFDLIAEYPWLVIKIFQDSTGVVAGRATYGQLKEKFALDMFRIFYSQKVIGFFLLRTRFSLRLD